MTLAEKKELFVVISIVVAVSLIVFINLLNKFDIYDFSYLIVCIVFLIRYITIKIKN